MPCPQGVHLADTSAFTCSMDSQQNLEPWCEFQLKELELKAWPSADNRPDVWKADVDWPEHGWPEGGWKHTESWDQYDNTGCIVLIPLDLIAPDEDWRRAQDGVTRSVRTHKAIFSQDCVILPPKDQPTRKGTKCVFYFGWLEPANIVENPRGGVNTISIPKKAKQLCCDGVCDPEAPVSFKISEWTHRAKMGVNRDA